MNGAAPLRSARLDIEPVRAVLANEVWPQLDDERLWRYFPSQRPATLGDLQRLYKKWERGSPHASQVWCNWLCRERSSGHLVASMQATVFPHEAVSYVAYMVFARHQRKGYASEATQAVIAYVRDTYAVRTFFAEMDKRNEPSYRLAESLGFKRAKRHDPDEYVYELRL